MSLPERIVLNAEQSFPIVEVDGLKELGHLDLGTGTIRIRADQPEAGKHHTLLHELIHLACECLVTEGVIKRQPPEKVVENLAGPLLCVLVWSGLYNGLSVDEFNAWMGPDEAVEREG